MMVCRGHRIQSKPCIACITSTSIPQPSCTIKRYVSTSVPNITSNDQDEILICTSANRHQSMSSSTIQAWAHALLNPSPLGLAIAILLAVSIPIFLHSVVFRASGLTILPSIVLIGPSGSGKTSLLTLVYYSLEEVLVLYRSNF